MKLRSLILTLSLALSVSSLASQDTIDLVGGAKAKQITLENGLKVNLISSTKSTKSSAALGVQVGHLDNPIESQGLAHYLEHMLFLGTKEFPEKEGFFNFVKSNGGVPNAYTSVDHTNYFFDIPTPKFEEGLHMFSRFFVSPLFTPKYAEGEKKVVDEEFQTRAEDTRLGRVFSAFLPKGNPWRSFFVGSIETLKGTKVEDTRKFFEEQYFAEAMIATLGGPQSLEELEALAKKYFSDIKSDPDRSLNTYAKVTPMDMETLPAYVKQKVQGIAELTVLFPVTSPKEEKKRLIENLANMLSSRSAGSLYTVLDKANFVAPGQGTFSAWAENSGVGFSFKITEKGAKQIDTIVGLLKSYVGFLQKSQFPEFLNEEADSLAVAKLADLSYGNINYKILSDVNRRFLSDREEINSWKMLFQGVKYEHSSSEDYINFVKRIDVANILVIEGNNEYSDKATSIPEIAQLENGGVYLTGEKGKRAVVDTLVDFSYEVLEITPEQFKKVPAEFTAQTTNPYIVTSFNYFKENAGPMFQLVQGPWGRIRKNPFPDLDSPRVTMDLKFYNPEMDRSSAKNYASLMVLSELINNQTSESSYKMIQSGVGIEVSDQGQTIEARSFGVLNLRFSGWADEFAKNFEDYLSRTNFSIDLLKFNEIKARVLVKDQVARDSDLTTYGMKQVISLIHPHPLGQGVFEESVTSLSYDEFKAYLGKLTSGLQINGLISGNIKPGTIDSVVESVQKSWLPKWSKQTPATDIPMLKPVAGFNDAGSKVGNLVERTMEGPSRENIFVGGFLNFGDYQDVMDHHRVRALGIWLGRAFFQEMRVERNLAYSPALFPYAELNQWGFMFFLPSGRSDAVSIQSQALEFVDLWFRETLPGIPPQALDYVKGAIMNRSLVPSESMARHNWIYRIDQENYPSIEAYQQDMLKIQELTMEDVKAFGKEVMSKPQAGSLVIINKKK